MSVQVIRATRECVCTTVASGLETNVGLEHGVNLPIWESLENIGNIVV